MKNILVPLLAAVMFLAVSCGIESFEPIISLAAPMSVSLMNSNNQILLQFHGFNKETYFEGYNIYVERSQASLSNGGGYRHIRSDGMTTNLPTMPNLGAVSVETIYSFWINRYYGTNMTDLNMQMTNWTYFVCVRAYSGTYLIESDPSAIASIYFVTNP